MSIAIAQARLFAAIAMATGAIADPRWNGSWREVPERSRLFIPGQVEVGRQADGAYRFVGDHAVWQCGGPDAGGMACGWSGRHRFKAVHRSSGPPPVTIRWLFDLSTGTLVAVTRTGTPRGPAAVEWSRYRKVGRTGLAGVWRKIADGETPTAYTLGLTAGCLHVTTADGSLDFRSPLLARAPTARERRAHRHVYEAVTPTHLVERSFDRGRLTGRSDLRLADYGASFVERHRDADGHVVRVYFARVPARRGAG